MLAACCFFVRQGSSLLSQAHQTALAGLPNAVKRAAFLDSNRYPRAAGDHELSRAVCDEGLPSAERITAGEALIKRIELRREDSATLFTTLGREGGAGEIRKVLEGLKEEGKSQKPR